MNEQEIRKLIRDEIQRNYRSGTPFVPPHQHNGNDNLRINQSNIVPNLKAVGGITLATEGRVYTLNVIGNPTSVLFYGTAVNNNGSSPTQKAVINGNAQLTQGSLFQATNSSTVTASKSLQTIIQCSNSMFINVASIAATAVRASESHIVFVQDTAGTELAVATVVGFSNTSVSIKVEVLGSGWQIIGNFLVI